MIKINISIGWTILLDILLGGHELPLALAWGHGGTFLIGL
jgi:hypothetical protein